MKLALLLFMTLSSVRGYSQIYFGTSHQYEKAKIFKKINDNYHNNILYRNPELGFKQCQNDHATILDMVKQKHKEHVGYLLLRIQTLSEENKLDSWTEKSLKAEVLNKIFGYIIVNEMKKELLSKNLFSFAYGRNQSKVFEMKYEGVDIEAYIEKIIQQAAKFKKEHGLTETFVKDFSSTFLTDFYKSLMKNSYKVVVNGVAVQLAKKIIANKIKSAAVKSMIKTSVVSFSGEVLMSFGKGFLLEILTKPLKGGRLPPESMWLELLEEYPGMILNPELMKDAGISDPIWSTHCNTINRRAHTLESRIKKLLKSIDKDFYSSVKRITTDYMHDYNEKMNDYKKPRVDNTYVAPRKIFKLPY